jgi:imidazolonepropionase
MISRGIPVALATDFNPGSCMTESLPLITTLACTQMRMTPAEAIQGIPLHAAGALRKEKVIASLEPGKQADLLLLGIPGYRRLSYHSGVNHVFKVIKKGRVAWEAESAHPRIRVDPR